MDIQAESHKMGYYNLLMLYIMMNIILFKYKVCLHTTKN
jgi:hypothetical protein